MKSVFLYRRAFSRILSGSLSVLAITLLLAVVAPLHAQFNASLSGTVVDTTQAAIPNATITLTNNGTQAVRTAQSGGEGSYRFSELPAGNYTLVVTAQGFQQSTVSNLGIAAESPRTINVALGAGKSTETVTVNGDTEPILQTSDASIGTTIDTEEVTRLPLVGSDPYELLRTAPGITGNGARAGSGNAVFLPNGAGPGGSNSSIFQTENQVQIIADGQRIGANNYMVDGVSVNSLTHAGSAVVTPNEEAVGSIGVVATSYDATNARFTGAQVQTVTKSGTNNLHGSAFFLYDNPGFNSYNTYGTGPGSLPVRNQNANRTWAGSIGGPVIKDKLFFFASFQEFKDKNPTYASQYVLTSQYRAALAAQRPGGVSAAIVGQASSNPTVIGYLPSSCSGLTVGTNCNVVNGGLDLGSFTPGGATQLGFFPANNTGAGLDGIPDVVNAQVLLPQQARGNQYNFRVDYQVTSKDLLAASGYLSKLSSVTASGTAPASLQSSVIFKPLNSSATLIEVHTFSPTWVNEARVNYTRFADNALTDGGNAVNYGLPYINVQNYPFAIQFGVAAATTTPATFAENTYALRDLVTHTRGANTVRFGAEVLWEQDNDNLYGYDRPTYAFNSLFAFANDASVYESVYANPATGMPATLQRYYRSQEVNGFIQDDWKVTPSLTLNAGLRYVYFAPWHNKGSQVYQPVLGAAGNELSATSAQGIKLQPTNNFWKAQYGNFGPKLGFAWSPQLFNNKVVVRGGYSLAYNDLDAALINVSAEDGPGVASFGLCCGANGNTAGIIYAKGTSNSPFSFPFNPALKVGVNPVNNLPVGVPGPLSAELYGSAPNIKYPSADLYSLEVQGELGHTMTATAGYQGSTGRHEARFVLQNFLYSQVNAPGFVYFLQTDSVENYNALILQLRRPMRKHIAYSFVYTYSKAMDQVSNGDGADGAANQTNPANNASEYGPADFDMKHHVVATGLYETPTIHVGNKLVQALISGYQINGTYTFNTGLPWTPVISNLQTVQFVNGAAQQNITRPLAYYGGAGSSCSTSAFESTANSNFSNQKFVPGQQSHYFQTNLPPNGVYAPGIGRNSFRSSCYQDVDMSFAKEFGFESLHRKTLLRLQANVFNILNENEAAPISNDNNHNNVTNANFGLSPAGDSGRVIELEGRFQF